MDVRIFLESCAQRKRALQERLTAALPDWFGIPEANRHYAAQAEVLPGLVAQADDEAVGLLLLKRHGAQSAEIYWLGVDPARHRHGIGTALVRSACASLHAEGAKFLFVATLHPSVAYEPYERTRLFYESMGFVYAHDEHGAEAHANPIAYYLKNLEPG